MSGQPTLGLMAGRDAERAERAYRAMYAGMRRRDGLYRRDGRVHPPGAAAHLWPFARAFVATLDLAGIEAELTGDFDADVAIADSLHTLERYWDASDDPPAYSSDVLGTRFGGDRYYDDNAWVGLALIQLERMRPESGYLSRARELFEFAVGGWDRRDVPHPGGVFWVQQGRGVGAGNHDRNTVSNAPNAELGLHLAELTGAPITVAGSIGVQDMYEWVLTSLDASHDSEAAATGLFWDKLRGDGSTDTTLWSYNQGTMVGANVLLARLDGDMQARYLARAQAIALKALRHYGAAGLERQPPAFNAIFFRNLLLLHAATADTTLRTEIVAAMRAYADHAWNERRDHKDRFHFAANGGVTVLNQSAMVQLFALLAWDPGAYAKLA